MIRDAVRAGIVARRFFQTVHGWLSVSNFEALEIEHLEEKKQVESQVFLPD
ncbi:MAG: hypothetical protein HYU29_06210 [Chloroflexi bacterium]|nr:hypothetical protein [Chloroflexota bacterium]